MSMVEFRERFIDELAQAIACRKIMATPRVQEAADNLDYHNRHYRSWKAEYVYGAAVDVAEKGCVTIISTQTPDEIRKQVEKECKNHYSKELQKQHDAFMKSRKEKDDQIAQLQKELKVSNTARDNGRKYIKSLEMQRTTDFYEIRRLNMVLEAVGNDLAALYDEMRFRPLTSGWYSKWLGRVASLLKTCKEKTL